TTDQTATATVDITVSRQTDDPPTADAQAQPSNIPSGQLVTLSASNSTDDFGITKYRWNPGDGTGWIDRGTFPTLSHRYTASVGTTFTATLEITDTSGQIDSDQVQVSVTVSNNPPVANLSLTAPTTGPSPLLVTFDGSLSTDDVGITKFEWDPGDGTGWHDQGVLTSYQHTYKPVATATYTARLRVTDGGGLTHIASTSITATVPNDCGLTGIGGPDAINVGQIITLTAQGAAPVYEWTENHPQLEFVGATDGPSVQVRALSVSGKIGDLTVWLNGANVTCNGSKTLTAYAISFTSPGADRRMYVNWEGGSATTEGREVTVNAIVSPPKAEVEVTLGFMDPD
ncbi:MAG TPA: PKD domain-containing protein, partial [bacterium]|nr:PKD domain-containing protein [bacterium]